jgi:hypothetical protein
MPFRPLGFLASRLIRIKHNDYVRNFISRDGSRP